MDHTDHFGFCSFLNMEDHYQNTKFWENSHFEMIEKHELIRCRYIFKSSPMLEAPAGFFISEKNNIPEFLGHTHFEEIVLLLIFGHSGGSQETF